MNNEYKPAFPTPGFPGVTKREHFAGEAMKGLLASDIDTRREDYPQALAESSLKCADALLAALDKE